MASEEERVEVLVDAVFDGVESEDNQAGDIPQLPPAERSETLTFTSSGEFRFLRWLLRSLSLWHPRSSGCFSRYFYPGLISLLLAFIAICTLVLLCIKENPFFKPSPSTELYFVVLFASAYFSHLAGWIYFRSRDFEDNVTSITMDARQLEGFRKQIEYYNVRTVLSLVIAIVWLGFNFFSYTPIMVLESGFLNNHHTYLQWLVLSGSVHVTGMYFAVLWIIDILQLVSNTRLRNQHEKFLKWTQGAEAAINDHICNYTTKVETSCRRLRFWFLIHNISLTILVPIIVLSNLAHGAYGAGLNLYIVAFIAVLYILIWAGPLYFAEQIEKNDERFCCEVNNFCPEQLTTALQNTAPRETAVVTLDQHLTFVSRTEVQLLVAYLKNIRSGFLAVGYTFQFKLSIVAAVFSLGALLYKTNFFTGFG